LKKDLTSTLIAIFCGAIFVYLLFPSVVIVLSSFSAAEYLAFPPKGFSLVWYERLLTSPKWVDSTLISIEVAIATTLLTVSIGTLASFALVRYKLRGSAPLLLFLVVPIAVPGIVTGISLLFFFMRTVRIYDTILALVIAHSLIGLPYVIRCVTISVESLDISLERAAMALGADWFHTFTKITLPLIKPGAISGAIFAFVLSLGEVSISMMITGARFTTLPVRVWTYVEWTFDPAVTAVSSILSLTAATVVYLIDKIIGLQTTTRLF
jgi:putative spermidine/putrescine transport system permease protein